MLLKYLASLNISEFSSLHNSVKKSSKKGKRERTAIYSGLSKFKLKARKGFKGKNLNKQKDEPEVYAS